MTLQPGQQLPHTQALASRVARSLLIRRWTGLLIGALPTAMALALIVVVAARWWVSIPISAPISDWWWGVPLVTAGLTVLGTGIVAWFGRPNTLHAAGWLDEAAHSQSRYRSALELTNQQSHDPAFGAIAQSQAEESASTIDIPKPPSTPWHEQRSIYWTGLALVLVIVAGLYMPSRQIADPVDNRPPAMTLADAREQISANQQGLEELAEQPKADPLIADALEDLEKLEQELEQEFASTDQSDDTLKAEPQNTAARATSRMDQLADQLDERSEQQRQEDQALRQQLDKLKSESLDTESNLDRFREALSEGRYEEALEELDAMEESLDSMSAQDREQAARDLESLSQAIKPEEPANEQTQPEEPTQAERLSEALEREAQRVREFEPDPPASSTPPSSEESPEPPPEERANEQENEQSSQESAEKSPSETSSDSQSESQNQSGESDQPDQSDQSNQGQTRQSPDPSQSGDQQPGQQPGQQPDDQPIQQPGQNQSQDQSQDQTKDQAKEQTKEGPSSKEDAPADTPTDPPALRKMLEEAQERSDGAQEDREMAERLRDQLQNQQQDQQQDRQNEQQNDQQNQQQDQQQDQQQGQQEDQQSQDQQGQPSQHPDQSDRQGQSGSPESSDPLNDPIDPNQEYVPVEAADAQDQADDDSTPIGRWYNPDNKPVPQGQSSSTAQRFRQAAKDARKQVDDRRVPRRYRDVIRNYFRQLDERATKLAPAQSSDGADAPNPKSDSESGSGS